MTRLSSWVPPVIWMAVIIELSGGSWSATDTGGLFEPLLRALLPWATPAQVAALHWGIRKLAHPGEYAILALLWYRALRREAHASGPAAWTAMIVAVAWAFLDEFLQSTTTTRTGTVVDVALDAAGATIALTIARSDWRRVADTTTTLLLWTASVGGVLAIVVNALAGVTSVTLWVTTPAAALLLFFRRRNGARRADPRDGRAFRDGPPS